ncbi:hypothetical protein [Streptomyces wuyuanensis]|uniref:Uncharacterized protein n=1 Tax=Streptomyces wuyuanensis TaxID=1196353 RepID=A0A1G9VYJ6_9ACTN|nr:hypothetical protein [Streptomyces wuyuanensis]SDM76835.1 hypothetical protein SAMN05444921_11333 [Streptomyces wuyuanensis]
MTTTTQHLRTIATLWTDLRDALAPPSTPAGFGIGLRGYLAQLEEYDLEEARALRALERDPAQIGQRPVPINLAILDTLRAVEAALVDTADQIAAANQRTQIQPAGPGWTPADRARRDKLAAADAALPQRWRFTGRRTGPYAALWLCARVHGISWPGTALTEQQHQHVAAVAAGALRRMETALDLADQRRELTSTHPCQCGGTIEVYGGAGASPVARCKACGALWTERGIIASWTAVVAA